MSANEKASWKSDRLYLGRHLTGYSVMPDAKYPTMWRVRQLDGTLSGMVNRTRAKDAAMAMLDRDMRKGAVSTCRAAPMRQNRRALA